MDKESLGKLARDVLNNDAFNKAFESVKEKLTQSWIDSNPNDITLKESAWASIKLLEKVKWELEYFMDEGNIEKLNRQDLEETEKKEKEEAKRKKAFYETPLPGTRITKKTE